MAVAMVVCRCRSVLRNVDFRGWDPNPKPKPPIWALESQNSLISNNGMRRAAEGFIILGKSSSNIGKVWILGFINLGKSSSNIGKELLMQYLQGKETLRCSRQKLTRVKWPVIVNYLERTRWIKCCI
ncbi:uncharacterized protein LOC115963485 isoform X2 [Quercus lobata]|uniref:uncharacterized protein LOC115963485 isoform X2 n=1 Tax=Quercus lobata TaxID=97700 RepID=UPI0012490FEB|nr:uncharacterized protein LOC115963485 isoform X2 [Quercus lobata]